jgi:hypothetical protein
MPKEESDRPWTEQQWEDFLRQADLRTARYGELMETLMDDPDREQIIDHEMGWDRKREAADEQWLQEVTEAAVEAQEALESSDDPATPDPAHLKKMDDLQRLRGGELDAIPAYSACEAASNAIDRALASLMRDRVQAEDEDIAQVFIQIRIAGAKIASGHHLGYEDEVIGGNVVNCKRALAAVEECQIALKLIQSRNVIPTTSMPTLFAHVDQAHKAISYRIEELRARMWWQH